jgi:hypothetical protein
MSYLQILDAEVTVLVRVRWYGKNFLALGTMIFRRKQFNTASGINLLKKSKGTRL